MRPHAPLLALSLLAAFPPALAAQITFESAALEEVLDSGDDAFGWALDLDGDTAAVGSINYNAGTGHVQIFERSGSTWTAGQTLFASDGMAGDGFGGAVALEGDELLIGAPSAQPGGLFAAGAVYVFRREAGVWSEVAKLVASDSAESARFGAELAIEGDLAAAAAPVHIFPTSRGQAYVLERIGGVWTETQRLTGDLGIEGFATTVAVASGRIFVGSPEDSPSGVFQAGSIYVYERPESAFTETARLSASDAGSFDGLGIGLAADGDRVVAGSPRHDEPEFFGAAYVFELGDDGWVETQEIFDAEENTGGSFGSEVALAGDLLAVQNASWTQGSFSQLGSVVVYRRSTCGFLPETRALGSELPNFAGFGHALALSGTTLLGGGQRITNDTAFVFELGAGPDIASYCTAGTTLSGCQASMSACGSASASNFGEFFVTASDVEGDRPGILFFGSAPNNAPWGSSSSTLCVDPPVVRTGTQQAGGAPLTCQGILALDFSAWMEAHPTKAPPVGTTTYMQAWFRDPASPKGTSLSDAISFPIAP